MTTATKKMKIWSIYEVGATYEGPLTEIESSSMKSAIDHTSAYFGVPKKRLYAVPGALLTGKPGRQAHSTKAVTASAAPKKKAPSAKAVDFFRKHAGYSTRPGESKARGKTRGAQALARAEAEAEARGWTVEWEHDPEEWDGDSERPFEVLTAVLHDADGKVLASLGGIGMTGTRKTDADYGRVIEAELAVEALG